MAATTTVSTFKWTRGSAGKLGYSPDEQLLIVDWVNEAMDLFRPRTVRGLHYYMVSAHGLPNNDNTYNLLIHLVKKARQAGLVDWDDVVDDVRPTIDRPHWDGIQHFRDIVIPQFRLNPMG